MNSPKGLMLSLLMMVSIGLQVRFSEAQTDQCSNIMRNATVSDYSSSYSDDFVPENLIDGNENRSWSSAEDDESPFVTFDLGNTFEITGMQLNGYFQANNPAYEGDSIRGFRLEAEVDGQLVTVVEGESPLTDRMISYGFSSSIVTDQVKLRSYAVEKRTIESDA